MSKINFIILDIIFILIININSLNSEVLSTERRTNWERVGSYFGGALSEGDLLSFHTINVVDYGAIPNDGIDDDEAIRKILNERCVYPNGIYILFDNGVYNFSKIINITDSKIIISGHISGKTILEFNLSDNDNAISITGQKNKIKVELLSDALKNTDIIIIENTSLFPNNTFIKIQDNDTNLISSTWAKYSTGQICNSVENINVGIKLEEKLRRSYRVSNKATIQRINPICQVEISNLIIKRKDKTNKQTSNIFINYGKDIIVKCIESYYCNFAHVDIRNSKNIEVMGSYFEDAFDYGGGGKAYGVILQSSSSDCLIHQNIFKHLRHSMLLQSGANGNVVSYNYSREPYWNGVSLPSNSAGDIVLHGNYPYLNLFEGNICQNIVIDNSHGKNGPFNTFFRNRAELYGIFMNINPASDSSNFIGNEITNSEILKGLYLLNGKGNFEYANNVLNTIRPKNTTQLVEKSYYLGGNIPSFYKGNGTWAPIGLPNKLNQYTNEAKFRYEYGSKTKCQEDVNSILDLRNDYSIKIYPNPCKDKLYIRIDNSFNIEIQKIFIYDINGTLIEQLKFPIKFIDFDKKIYYQNVYFLKILLNNKKIITRKIIIE